MVRARLRLVLLGAGVSLAVVLAVQGIIGLGSTGRIGARDDGMHARMTEAVHLEGATRAQRPPDPSPESVEEVFEGEPPEEGAAQVLHDPRTDPLTAAWIDVVVIPGAGTPPAWEATVYVLPAGARGAERVEELPHASIKVGEVARVPIAVEGSYDIGLVSKAIQLMERDVPVKRGENRLELRLPPMAPVRFQLKQGIPPNEPNVSICGFVHLERGTDSLSWREFPGRDEVRHAGPLVMLRGGAGTEVASDPVPRTERWLLDSSVHESETTGSCTTSQTSPRWELTTDAETATAGDVVALSVRPKGRVLLRFKPSVSQWPGPPGYLDITFVRRHDGDSWGWGRYVSDDAALAALCRTGAERALGSGAWDIEWEGRGIERGSLAGVEVVGGATVERTIELRPAPPDAADPAAEVAPRVPLWVDAGVSRDIAWTGFGVSRQGGPVALELEDDRTSVPGSWRGDRCALAVGSEWISALETVPASGAWRPRLERAGYARFAPGHQPHPALGHVVARRADGLPLPTLDAGGSVTSVSTEFGRTERVLEPDLVLGPFPPGPLRLEILVGRHSVGIVDILVRPGLTETFGLPR